MGQIIHFKCPECERELRTTPGAAMGCACPRCGQPTGLRLTESVEAGLLVDMCSVCGHSNLYIQKDFNRALGLGVVAGGVLASVVLFAAGNPFLAMLALVAMALVDALIYWIVPEVTVCYTCHAIYRGFARNPEHEPFNLELLERYGGQAPRR